MKVTTLAGIGVVVTDLDRAMPNYARLLGVDAWHVQDWTSDRLSAMASHGRRSAGTYRSALGRTPFDPQGEVLGKPQRALPFELVQPTGGETPFAEFLLSKGEGIAYLTVVSPDAEEADDHFGRLGVQAAHTQVRDDGRRRTFWDTRSALGGYLLEVVPAAPEASGTEVTVDGAALRSGRPHLAAQGVQHFGVVVDDTMAALEHYHRILGIETWAVKTWQTEFGRLDAPYYRDLDPVEHGYFTAQGFCEDFGFEVIQCKYGPSHYNREFADQRGPGIHHVFSYLTTDQADWTASVDAMTALGSPLIMGSVLRGGASEYGYFDTFGPLGGFLIEGVHRRHPPEPRYLAPDFEVDFGAKAGEE